MMYVPFEVDFQFPFYFLKQVNVHWRQKNDRGKKQRDNLTDYEVSNELCFHNSHWPICNLEVDELSLLRMRKDLRMRGYFQDTI